MSQALDHQYSLRMTLPFCEHVKQTTLDVTNWLPGWAEKTSKEDKNEKLFNTKFF